MSPSSGSDAKRLPFFNQLTRLIAREDFINFSRRESFRTYIIHGNLTSLDAVYLLQLKQQERK
jgi:hypothetical protein